MLFGVVLAGGLSSRMGRDKAAMQLPGSTTTMLSHSKMLLQLAGVDKVLVSGNGYDIADIHSDIGPIGGLYASVSYLKKHFSAVVGCIFLPVDMPQLNAGELVTLYKNGTSQQQNTYFSESILPLYLHFSDSLEQALEVAISNQHYSLYKMIKALPHSVLPLENTHQLININTPDDWQSWQKG